VNYLQTKTTDGVALVTLDDPPRRNALSLAMAGEIVETLASLEASPELGALVVTGAPPAFSAGADLDDLARADRDRLRGIYEGFLALSRFPLPTIAAVNGPAVGAGLNLALACDVRLAARRARFESRFIDLALHPGGGHTWMLRQLLGPQGAAAVVLCGEGLDGEAAAARGLAWRCVEDDVLVEEALGLARIAASAPRELMKRLKATLRSMAGVTEHDTAVERELEPQLWSVEQPEFRERLAALKRRISRSKS
jgi:enoyl-CoA hydratase